MRAMFTPGSEDSVISELFHLLAASQAVLTSCEGSTLPLTSSECAALPGMLLKSPATSMGMSALQECKSINRHSEHPAATSTMLRTGLAM